MMRLLPYCLPLARRVSRPFRRVSRGTGVATAAKFTAGAIILGGRVCFDVLMWGGGAAPMLPAPAPYAAPILPSQSVFGGYGGSIYGGSVDTRDFAALVPALRAADFLTGTTLVPLDLLPTTSVTVPPPVTTVPEPSSLAIMAVGLAAVLWIRRRRRVWTPTGRTEQAHTLFGLRPYLLVEEVSGNRRRWRRS